MKVEIHSNWMGFKKFPTYRVNEKYYTRLFFMWFATTLVTKKNYFKNKLKIN